MISRTDPRRSAAVAYVLGAIWLAGPAWVLATRFDAVGYGHPAYAVVLAAAALMGVLVLALALRVRSRPRNGSRRTRQAVASVLGLALTLVLVGSIVWLRPYGPDATAVAAMSGAGGVSVTQDATSITLLPPPSVTATQTTAHAVPAGLIFQPGAKVDARAYVPLLTPLAQAGHSVIIIKQPLGIGFLALGAPERIVDGDAVGRRWIVAGHSLGGVAAARAAASGHPRIRGLALWASFPDDATTVPAQPVVSIYGTRDALATPADIEASRHLLPADTRFVPITGGIHAYFGDYGPQSGDGEPTIDRAEAQAQITAAMLDMLSSE